MSSAREPSAATEPRRLARNLGFSLVVSIGFLLCLEAGLRLVGFPDPGIYAGDPGSVWWLQPELEARSVEAREIGRSFTVRTNRLGCRGPAPESGGLACLGDSTTFGWGVEEDEAWPARLAQHLGQVVLNAGVPGHSTHQGLATMDRALSVEPHTVILGYIVRDAELATAADADRRAQPPIRILRAMSALRRAPRPSSEGELFRVPPPAYRENLEAMLTRVERAGARPVLLAFPMQRPSPPHLDVLRSLAPRALVLEPHLSEDEFFDEDPLHLTAAGNDRLAQLVAEAL